MRKRIVCVILLCILFLTSACMEQPSEGSAPTGIAGSPSEMSGEHSTGSSSKSLHFIGQGAPLGDGNKEGYYYLKQRGDASFNIQYVDYDSLSEITLCNRLECTHDDENCPAWRPYGGSSGCVLPIGDYLYILFYGSMNHSDFEKYGDMATMHIEKTSPNGGNPSDLISLSASEYMIGGIATDDKKLYMTIETVVQLEDSSTDIYRQIYAIDLETGAIEKSAKFDQTDVQIIGASGSKLLLRYYNAAQDLSNTKVCFATYDIDTKEWLDILTQENLSHSCTASGESLYWIEKDEALLVQYDYLRDEKNCLPIRFNFERYEDVTLSYALSRYINVLLYESGQPATHGLIDLSSGTLSLLTLEAEASADVQDKTIQIFTELPNNQFLISGAISYSTVNYPSGDSVIPLTKPTYELAVISIEDCINNIKNFKFIKTT